MIFREAYTPKPRVYTRGFGVHLDRQPVDRAGESVVALLIVLGQLPAQGHRSQAP